jgi:3-isopropylmalate dehydrogenase
MVSGQEVMAEVRRVIDWFGAKRDMHLMSPKIWLVAQLIRYGTPLPHDGQSAE